jgi:hypothetical protein
LNKDDAEKLLMKQNKNGNNFVHILVSSNTFEAVHKVFSVLKENFNYEQYKRILQSESKWSGNLLQTTKRSKDLQTHKFLWKTFRDFYECDEDFDPFFTSVTVMLR